VDDDDNDDDDNDDDDDDDDDDVASDRRPTRYADGATRTNAAHGMQHAVSAATKAG